MRCGCLDADRLKVLSVFGARPLSFDIFRPTSAQDNKGRCHSERLNNDVGAIRELPLRLNPIGRPSINVGGAWLMARSVDDDTIKQKAPFDKFRVLSASRAKMSS